MTEAGGSHHGVVVVGLPEENRLCLIVLGLRNACAQAEVG